MALGFVRWHLAAGFDHLYLTWDDPGERPPREIVRRGVTHLTADRRRWRRLPGFAEYGPHVGREVMARQVLNVEAALARARADGMRWLLHLDIDELWVARAGGAQEHFRTLDASPFDGARYLNLEGVPERADLRDPFREVTLFKVNEKVAPSPLPFLAYVNGKSAVRVGDGIRAHGVHLFARGPALVPSVLAVDPAIFHYVSCGYRQWRDKYRLLGGFADRWFRRHPIGVPFHLESRDVWAGGDERAARRFYRERVVMSDRAEVKRLLAAGALERRTEVRRTLSRWRP